MSKLTSSPAYTQAMQYLLTQGYSVIPVGKDKKPLISWKEYQSRLPTEEEVAEWFVIKYPEAGVGIVTGKVSGITVVDIDVKGEEVTDREVFPLTYTVKTKSGGYHLYYEYDGGTIKTGAEVDAQYPHVDIRNDGGYVVAPPTEGYEVLEGCPLDVFPSKLFSGKRKQGSGGGGSFKLSDAVGKGEGGRNQTITQVIGKLLRGSAESLWQSDIWPTVVTINDTMNPPLPKEELKRTFESVATAERAKRDVAVSEAETGLVESPMQITELEAIRHRLRGKSGNPFKDVTNAVYALSMHSEWKWRFRYDAFKQQVLWCEGDVMRQLEPADVIRTQMWLQRDVELANISKNVVQDAIDERAAECSFNSAVEWLKSLEWDGVPRVDGWLSTVYGVDDDEYHRSIGSNWLRAIVKRLVRPGSQFDYVLVIQGGQGVRKTTAFLRLGGPWHMETIVQAESKDFLMQFQGKAIIELAEGDTLNRSETRALKAIITRTHDKYRAPYARADEEHPRQCVFCMTTNDLEFLKDETGNRRWWIVEMPDGVVADTDWITENREQLFAEAYARVDEDYLEVPQDEVQMRQEDARNVSVLEEKVVEWYEQLAPEVKENGVTVEQFFNYLYIAVDHDRIPKDIPWQMETKIKNAFKGALGLTYKQRRDKNDWNRRVRRWYPRTSR